MTVFSEKLSRLSETIELVCGECATTLAGALRGSRGRLAVAIGSGGSAVTAEYFARCRTTLQLGPTLVMTPMQFVMSMEQWGGSEIWLFSAGANNPDIGAAYHSASASQCGAIRLMTTRNNGATTIAAANNARASIFRLPVADPKDGFLATHSMIAMIAALALACDRLIEQPRGNLLVRDILDEAERAALPVKAAQPINFEPGDTILVLHDPQLAAVAVLVETSLWETGIAPVQRTDFRNFAHGRHVWAARHASSMFVFALTTLESRAVWQPVQSALPKQIRGSEIELGHGGRLSNARGILRGLAVIEELGRLAGIDPGRPGRGAFAEAIYDDTALATLSASLTASVRHKGAARLLHDPGVVEELSICAAGSARMRDLAAARFSGVALDYDGTVVPNQPTEARLGPPSAEVMNELVRLVDSGVQVGFATGRGGSAGERLRDALPSRVHPKILMGYYNGAYIRSLDVDIRGDRPAPDPDVSLVRDWVLLSGLLRSNVTLSDRPLQITIDHDDIVDVEGFAKAMENCPQAREGQVRILSSHHSFDIVAHSTSKLRVIDALRKRAGNSELHILGIGDSGSPLGNDRELLSEPHGLSVGSVCGHYKGAWTLFGFRPEGPEAVALILRSMQINQRQMMIDMTMLGLD